jgi:hypothetical protein
MDLISNAGSFFTGAISGGAGSFFFYENGLFANGLAFATSGTFGGFGGAILSPSFASVSFFAPNGETLSFPTLESVPVFVSGSFLVS